MKSFTDNTGRSWSIVMTIGSVKRVRDLLGVNLLEPESGDPPLMTRLGTDEILLCDVIYCLIKPQAEEQGVSDEQFGAALGGEAILSAQKAFYDELIDFFQLRGRKDRAKMMEKQAQIINLSIEKAEMEIDGIDLEQSVNSAFGKPSTKSPESSELTQAD